MKNENLKRYWKIKPKVWDNNQGYRDYNIKF